MNLSSFTPLHWRGLGVRSKTGLFLLIIWVPAKIQEVNLVNPDYPAHFCTPLEIEVYQIIL